VLARVRVSDGEVRVSDGEVRVSDGEVRVSDGEVRVLVRARVRARVREIEGKGKGDGNGEGEGEGEDGAVGDDGSRPVVEADRTHRRCRPETMGGTRQPGFSIRFIAKTRKHSRGRPRRRSKTLTTNGRRMRG
jgi:hypothetical protein